ncbi:uncharacterized protein [Venturia canescens]|uniref:uncharacterized protein isoform X1 n=1 Tax=Venturia canescens TaxID=32260 RepID=UPI001C9C1A45|nr:uncharacterized protein LOC122418962 isoform X1 [Venturia canescens]
MLIKWLFFVSSFIHFSMGSTTFGDSKTSLNFQPPSSTLGKTSLRNRRDRRMTHWESEPHSNFDDGDNNEDRERISFSSILEEPSLLQSPLNIKIAEKSSSLESEVTENRLTGSFSRLDNCIVDVYPLRSVVPWLLFPGVKYNSRVSRNGALGVRKLVMPHCGKIGMQDQKIQEPIYVDEPGWIMIALNRQGDGSQESSSEGEPFYVARGRRSVQISKDEDASKEGKSEGGRVSEFDLPIRSDLGYELQESSYSMRKKRDTFSENLRKYMIGNGASGLVSSRFTERSRQNSYVHPRNKHSDILDILNEPFFISRGKKNSLGIQRSESNDEYSAALVNFEMKKEFLDAWKSRKTKKNCDSNSASDCARLRLETNEPPVEPFRDRRGVEELLKDADPFYLSRGKRSPSTIHEFNHTAQLNEFTKVINKNLSIGVQHS